MSESADEQTASTENPDSPSPGAIFFINNAGGQQLLQDERSPQIVQTARDLPGGHLSHFACTVEAVLTGQAIDQSSPLVQMAIQFIQLDANSSKVTHLVSGPAKGGTNRAQAIQDEVHSVWQRDADELWTNKEFWEKCGKKQPSLNKIAKELARRYRKAVEEAPPEEKDRLERYARTAGHIRNTIKKPA
jgi:hypothetical protein